MSESSVPVPRPPEGDETPLPLTTKEECDAKVAAAHAEISALCHGKRWLMSIPVRPEADSDTIICDALRALKDRVKILEAELARPSSEEAANSDTLRKLATEVLDELHALSMGESSADPAPASRALAEAVLKVSHA